MKQLISLFLLYMFLLTYTTYSQPTYHRWTNINLYGKPLNCNGYVEDNITTIILMAYNGCGACKKLEMDINDSIPLCGNIRYLYIDVLTDDNGNHYTFDNFKTKFPTEYKTIKDKGINIYPTLIVLEPNREIEIWDATILHKKKRHLS